MVIDITKKLPTSISVTLPVGRDTDLRLRFESILKLCASCQQLGHYQMSYPNKLNTTMEGSQALITHSSNEQRKSKVVVLKADPEPKIGMASQPNRCGNPLNQKTH